MRANSLLSRCARDYLEVRENPFAGKLACLPIATVVPTKKSLYTIQGTMVAGTTGTASVIFAPYRMLQNTASAAAATTAASTNINTVDIATANNTTYVSNSPHAGNTAANDLRGRLVGAGIRVRYIGTENNRGGLLWGLENPVHAGIQNSTFESLQSYGETRSFSVDREWKSVVYHPLDEDESDWFSTTDSLTVPPQFFLGFWASGLQSGASASAFQFECVAIFEEQGRTVRGTTPSLSDPVGYAAIQNASSQMELRKPISGTRTPIVQKIFDFAGMVIRESISGYVQGRNSQPRPLYERGLPPIVEEVE